MDDVFVAGVPTRPRATYITQFRFTVDVFLPAEESKNTVAQS